MPGTELYRNLVLQSKIFYVSINILYSAFEERR